MEAKLNTPIRRGTKRKAKADPYQDTNDTDVDIISRQKPPSSQQRVARPRVSSGTPNSKDVQFAAKRHIGRSSLNAQRHNDAETNLVQAKASNAAGKQQDLLVPVASMGDLADIVDECRPKGEDSNHDKSEIHEVASLLKHRMASDQSGHVELLVHWVGESEEDATWEAEEEIQRGAEDMLYAYWRTRGGRSSILFHKPNNPPAEMYYVYNILRHKKHRGGFQFEVQWVGHSNEPHETTTESETKLKNIALGLLDEYWGRVGGRESYLAKRSIAKDALVE